MARTVKCPGCGADLTVKDGNRDFMFCEYCGTKVRLDDYQETHRYVNEAQVKGVEAFKDIAMKRMEFQEKKRQEKKEEEERNRKYGAIVAGVCVVIVVVGLIFINFMASH